MSESTAVAEAPEVTIPTTETPAPTPVETTPAPVEDNSVAAEPTTEADNADIGDDPEWQSLVGAPAEEAKPDAAAKGNDLPGESFEDIEARLDGVRMQRQARRLQATDANWRQFAEQELGLSPQEASALQERVLGPVLREMHADHDAYYQELWRRAVAAALPEEAAKTYMSRQYRGPAEVAKTMYELGKRDAEATWQSKVKNRELFDRKAMDAARQNGINIGRGRKEDAGEVDGTNSGERRKGSPPTGTLTYTQIQKMSPKQIEAIPDDVFQRAVAEGK